LRISPIPTSTNILHHCLWVATTPNVRSKTFVDLTAIFNFAPWKARSINLTFERRPSGPANQQSPVAVGSLLSAITAVRSLPWRSPPCRRAKTYLLFRVSYWVYHSSYRQGCPGGLYDSLIHCTYRSCHCLWVKKSRRLCSGVVLFPGSSMLLVMILLATDFMFVLSRTLWNFAGTGVCDIYSMYQGSIHNLFECGGRHSAQ